MEVISSKNRLPADGKAYATLRVRVKDPEIETITLRLSGPGSFDPHIPLRKITASVSNGEAVAHVYSARRPGMVKVSGAGVMHRIEVAPVNALQRVIFDWAPTIALSLIFALVLRTYAFASFYIPSGSMENTMHVGDLFFTENISYRVLNQEPRRGDIVVFEHPDDGKTVIKRVIGLPGDRVEVRDGVVLINDSALDEDYISEQPFRDYGPVTVPEDGYFVMGDNRNNSIDSRYWGVLPRENLKGRAALVFWPPARAKVLKREGY